MARMIGGKLRLDFESVNLAEVIDAALEIVRPTAQVKSIDLKTRFNAQVGVVIGDRTRLQQIIWNLLSNAVKFTPKGGQVEVRLERANSQAQIIVSDSGQGISPVFLPRVFERFEQADNTEARQHGGLGLGLSIVRHLVEMHGGSVKAESLGDGHGATFIVSLPLKAVQTEAGKLIEEHETELRQLLERLPGLAGVQVLVVDDEASAREIIKAVLVQCGAEVRTVGSVTEALKAIADSQPDVLVSDIGMPDETGYELIAKVRRLDPEAGGNIPAVALTAYANTEDRMRALAAGFQIHVPKPVEPGELALVVASLVKRLDVKEE
jgi:CheY-like chemotaxis protein